MLPTYSFSEIKNIIRSFDLTEISVLQELVKEEIECYPVYESRAILRLISIQIKAVGRNEVQLEFLLAYN